MKLVLAEKSSADEKREKRAHSISAMGLVKRDGDHFRVSTPSLRGRQTAYEVWRDENGKIRCSCLEFEENSVGNQNFRCEHILAVKFSLLAKTTEILPNVVSQNEKNATVANAEIVKQESHKELNAVSTIGQVEENTADSRRFADTKDKKEIEMKQENYQDMGFVTADEASKIFEKPSNVVQMNFASTLRNLRQHVEPQQVKQREGWRDSRGNVHLVDYVEWHTVADILDEKAANWSHTIRDIKQIGNFIVITAAISIDGITREGVGTGDASSEMGIKKAEHDALKRAAVKFGIARELYKKDLNTADKDGFVPPSNDGFPANPVARSLADLVTAKQLGMIRAMSRDLNLDAETECQAVLNCKTDELSKRAASVFITHLQDLSKQQEFAVENAQPMRRAS